MIAVRCGQCGETFGVPSSMAGQAETCPSCRAMVKVPVPGRRPCPAVTSSPPARPGATSRSAWIGLFAMLGGGFIVLAVGLRADSERAVLIGGLAFFGAVAFAVGAVPGMIAERRNLANADGIYKMGILGLFLGAVFWFVALALALAGTPRELSEGGVPVAADRMACPTCGESIPRAARICRFCNRPVVGP